MKGLPPMVWIIGIFLIGAVGILLYSRIGPDALPPAENAWSYAEQFRRSIQFRRSNLGKGEKQEMIQLPYRIELQRLDDLPGELSVARYVLKTRPLKYVPKLNAWVGPGVDMALIDVNPFGPLGDVRFVALHRLEDGN